VVPEAPTTYTITAVGPGGAETRQLTVTVVEPPPPDAPVISEFSAQPTAVREGDSVELTWATSGATSAVIDPDVGTTQVSGSARVTLRSSTDFTLTATGPGGSVQKQVTVNVSALEPTATMTANGQSDITITQGDTVHLCWSTANARHVDINGTNEAVLSGCVDFRPQSSDSYQLHASGDGGNVSASVRIGVQARAFSPPPRQLPPRPALPTSGDIVWYGKSGFFGHRTVNIYLGWYPLGEGGRWYPLPESDGKFTGSIPWPNFRLSWSADNEPVTSPRLVTAQPGNRPVRITFTFNRSGDHVIRFHWEQAP
jgi:hypothetical protein